MRVSAVLRRSQNTPTSGNILVSGNISLDVSNYRISVKGEVIETSPTEFKLLNYLMQNMDRVLTREQILSAVWGLDFATDGAVLDTYISYLRKKLGDNANIRTIRGVGYQIESK